MRIIGIEGQTFGRWTVLERDGVNTFRQAMWLCRCSCGTTRTLTGGSLRGGQTQSCGCLSRELAANRLRGQRYSRIHGFASRERKHPLYLSWKNMVARCENRKSPTFQYYGAQGIAVCSAWRRSAEKFIRWALKQGWVPGLQVGRRNHARGYFPQNCSLVTKAENVAERNQRVAQCVS